MLENWLRGRISEHRLCLCNAFEQCYVLGDNLELAAQAIVEIVRFRELLKLFGNSRVLVAWHCREKVVLKLPLHPPPENVRDRIVAFSIASRAELSFHEIIPVQIVVLTSGAWLRPQLINLGGGNVNKETG